MKKRLVLLVMTSLVLLCNVSWADRLIIRGLYDANAILEMKHSETILGVNVSDKKAFEMSNGAAGVGVEMEFVNNDAPGLALGVGYNHYANRAVPSVKSTYKVGGLSAITTDTLSNAELAYSYLFVNLKYYLGQNFYVGAQYRMPKIELVGSDWDDNRISDIKSYGVLLGSNVSGGLCWELGYATNTFLVNTDYESSFSSAFVSLGFAI